MESIIKYEKNAQQYYDFDQKKELMQRNQGIMQAVECGPEDGMVK